jgi:hypothetical protein
VSETVLNIFANVFHSGPSFPLILISVMIASVLSLAIVEDILLIRKQSSEQT